MFAFVSSITPGPNNIMLLSSGVNFGFRASVPHMAGITAGFSVMLIVIGLGLSEAFSRYPLIYTFMKWIGAGYLLYLAWGIATTGEPSSKGQEKQGKPMSFLVLLYFNGSIRRLGLWQLVHLPFMFRQIRAIYSYSWLLLFLRLSTSLVFLPGFFLVQTSGQCSMFQHIGAYSTVSWRALS